MPKIRVLLADDHPVVRTGIRHLLESCAEIEVVGEAGDGGEALQLVAELAPDVLVVDIEMKQVSGIEVARRLQDGGLPVRLLVLSAHDDEEYIQDVLASGAAGYLTKDEAEEVIVEAVRAVAGGEQGWLSRSVTAKMMRMHRQKRRSEAGPLGCREAEVVELLAAGHGNKQIAAALGVSANTVKNHLANIYAKLGVHSRLETVLWAQSHGLIASRESCARKPSQ